VDRLGATPTPEARDARRVRTWTIGDITVTSVIEVDGPAPGPFLFDGATPDVVRERHGWARGSFIDDEGMLLTRVQALVVQAGGRTIVVDTCIGNDKQRDVKAWNQLDLPFLERFREAGFDPLTVDAVVCTHLHVDHVGWNTTLVDGAWRPTFPESRYVFAGPEYRHWSAEPHRSRPEHDDSIQPVVDAGLVDLVDMDAELAPGVTLVPTPGHTPGHCSVQLASDGATALITGDFMHHAVQVAAPEWCSHFDTDASRAEQTRREFLDAHADTDLLVIGTHFGGPGAGRIVSADRGYVFVPEAT
jgi:glyoxylase-like metal-dependent hydrolase (beta-lactamase superfamily II)